MWFELTHCNFSNCFEKQKDLSYFFMNMISGTTIYNKKKEKKKKKKPPNPDLKKKKKFDLSGHLSFPTNCSGNGWWFYIQILKSTPL